MISSAVTAKPRALIFFRSETNDKVLVKATGPYSLHGFGGSFDRTGTDAKHAVQVEQNALDAAKWVQTNRVLVWFG